VPAMQAEGMIKRTRLADAARAARGAGRAARLGVVEEQAGDGERERCAVRRRERVAENLRREQGCERGPAAGPAGGPRGRRAGRAP